MTMTISVVDENKAEWAADKFIDYFQNFSSIEDYLRYAKGQAVSSMAVIPGISDKDAFLNEDIHPQDMDFEVKFVGDRFQDSISQDIYIKYLTATSSHVIEHNIPGRELRWMVYEKNTKKIIGFIRFGSPTINSKPRNIWLGKAPDLSRFNRHAVMGFAIVPSQPFGFNYLGGKLLALLCCSHEAREQLNSKYGSDICLFETTSLYGTTKSSSQYDGLKPYMRYKGLTMSDFTPLLHDDVFKGLNKWFIARNNDKLLVKEDASSRKLKTQQKMISIIKKNSSSQKAAEFQTAIANAKNLTEKKRVYFSDYGFANSREVIRGDTDKLEKNPINFDKFYQENLIKWWKNKASKRYESLKSSGSLRTELEVWTKDMHIDIIR